MAKLTRWEWFLCLVCAVFAGAVTAKYVHDYTAIPVAFCVYVIVAWWLGNGHKPQRH